ncbi:MAG: hypothetical protein REH79_02760 [Spiroplasma sp.]|nr:hypothetical protein [Spiroplasma sp.]
MKKLLTSLTGLIAISVGSTTPILNQIQQKDNIKQQLAAPKEWHINNFTNSKKSLNDTDWKYFAIDNINLSSLGILSVSDLNQYNIIDISGIEIKFSNDQGYDYHDYANGRWSPKHLSLTSQPWTRDFSRNLEYGFYIALERAATMWHNNDGDLMLRLAYHAIACTFTGALYGGATYAPGTISFTTGSVVRFY